MKVRLGDYVDLLTGFPFQSPMYTQNIDDVLLLRGDNIAQGWLRWDGAKRWPKSDCETYAQFELQPGDVILAMDRPWIEAGLKWAWVREHSQKMLLVQRVARMRGINGLQTAYLRYLIGSPEFTAHVLSIITGVNVPHISGTDIKSFRFELPLPEHQRRVAGILAAYDELIDLNLSRNKIIREMARRIFDEWLIEVADDDDLAISVPANQIVTGSLGGDWGVEQPEADQTEEVRVIRGTDIPDLSTGNFARCPTRYISPRSFRRRMLVPGDIIVENSINAKSRPAGTAFLVTAQVINALGGRVIAASFCRVFKTNSSLESMFLLTDLDYLHRHRKIEQYQVVAANGIANFQSTRFLSEHMVRIPKEKKRREVLGSCLVELHSPVFAVTISNLRNARDLLLPKLISGAVAPVATQDRPCEQVAAQ